MTKILKLSELTGDNIGDWPLLVKITAVFLSSLLLCMGMYLYVLQAQFQELDVLHAQGINLQRTLAYQRQQLNQHASYEKQLKILQKNWASKTEHLSDTDQVADLLIDIAKIGTANGLQFKSIMPLPDQQQDALTVIPIEIYIEGQQHKLVSFLQQLSVFKQSVHIKNFTLTTTDTVTTLKLLLNIYRTEIALANADAVGVAELTTVTVETLQMVGYLQQGNKQWALLATPNGYVYRVTMGMRIGQHQGKVTRIDKDKIEIIEDSTAGLKNLVLRMHK